MGSIASPRRARRASSHIHVLLLTLAAAGIAGSGCARSQAPAAPARIPAQAAAPAPTTPEGVAATSAPAPATETSRIEADPIAFLRDVYQRAEALEQYKLDFWRQERSGLVRRLGSMEEIRAAFRKTPFSVRFVWDNPDDDYHESVYVAGQNGNKLIVRERKGFLGLPPTTRTLDIMDPVKWGKSKNPVTDFGLAQVTRRTLDPFENPATAGAMTIRYEGVVNLEPNGRPAHHLRIERPPMKEFRYTEQDFYVDKETLLPAGTDLFAGGKLDARYRYANIDANVMLTDADFRIGSPMASAAK